MQRRGADSHHYREAFVDGDCLGQLKGEAVELPVPESEELKEADQKCPAHRQVDEEDMDQEEQDKQPLQQSLRKRQVEREIAGNRSGGDDE